MTPAALKKISTAFPCAAFEELDDDPIRFWDLVIAALRQCRPTLGETALALLHSPQSLPLSTVLTALLHDVERNTQDIILILDDYHVISDQAICDSMSFLLNHVPSTLHVVLVGRADPDLPLPRFRVRGQLFEIRDQDLRFTEAETAHFLRHATGLPLSEEEVATLSRQTEGWIAGLQLAALSLHKRPDYAAVVKDFAGAHRYLLDYVQQDILAPLPTPLQDFLLQTSIVPRMNAALCQAVTAGAGASESQEMLQALEQANLFLVPLDSERQWYRYHELFREALLARLHASQPQLVPLLHLRAARFYEAQHEWREAITHALTVPDHAYAASLMEQAAWPFWLRGEARTIHTWVFSLPDAILRARVHLALDAAFRFIDSVNLSTDTRHDSVVAQVENTFTRIEGLLREQQRWAFSETEVALTRRRLHLLRALIELRVILQQNDGNRLRDLMRELEALPSDEKPCWTIIPLYIAFWLTTVYQGYGVALIPRLCAARQRLLEIGDLLMTTRLSSWLACVRALYAAQLRQAQQDARSALALAKQIGTYTPSEGYLYYCLFVVSYVWNRLEEASDWLAQFSFPKENRNCGWQKPRCSVHLHVEGPVIMSWPRHPRLPTPLPPIQGIWSASHGCSETSKHVQRHVVFLRGAQSRDSAARADRVVTPRGMLLAGEPPLWYTSWCWEELKGVGNNADTGKVRCPEHLFTH